MNIFPAIDLKDNKCVRLSKGEDSTSVVFNPNPIEQAKYFQDQGCTRLHLVDLDSAFGRNNINNKTIKEEIMDTEFEMDGDFADFVNDLTEDKANDNAVCGIDSEDCDSCGA